MSVEAFADNEISTFEDWFVTRLGEQPLSKYERAILKTYIIYRCKKEEPKPLLQEAVTPPTS